MEQYKWYIGTFQPKDLSTLKEWMKKFIGKEIRVQASWIIEEWPFKWQWALSYPEMFWDIASWIPEEDFITK